MSVKFGKKVIPIIEIIITKKADKIPNKNNLLKRIFGSLIVSFL